MYHIVSSNKALTAQAPKNWRWAVQINTQKRCLNGSTLPVQAPTQDAKLAARGYTFDFHCRFVHTLVINPLQCLSLAVRKFYSVSEECCMVCCCWMSWCLKHISTSSTSAHPVTTQLFCMMVEYTEDLA